MVAPTVVVPPGPYLYDDKLIVRPGHSYEMSEFLHEKDL